MKKLILVLALFISTPAFATDRYFDYTGGSDAHNCSDGTSNACKTWAGKSLDALNALSPDDKNYFKCGEVWPEGSSEVAVNSDGTSGHPIVIDHYGTCTGSNDPILRGASVVSSFSACTTGVCTGGTAIYQKTFGGYQGVYIVGVDGTQTLTYWPGSVASMPAGTFQPNYSTPTTVRFRLYDSSDPAGHTIYMNSTAPDNNTGNRGLLRGGKENGKGKYLDAKNIKVQYSAGVGASASGNDNHWDTVKVQGAANDGILAYRGGPSTEDAHGFRCHNCEWSQSAVMGTGHGQGFTTYTYDTWVYGDPPTGGTYTSSGHDNAMACVDFLSFGSTTDVHNSGMAYVDIYNCGGWQASNSYDPGVYFDGANNAMMYGCRVRGSGTVTGATNLRPGVSIGSEHSDIVPAHHIYVVNSLIFGNRGTAVSTGNTSPNPNITDIYFINDTLVNYSPDILFNATIGLASHAGTAAGYHYKNCIFYDGVSMPTNGFMPDEPVGNNLQYLDMDHNLYWRRGGYSIIYGTQGSTCKTSTASATCWDLARWRTNSGQDANSLFADPLITTDSDTAFDAHLQAGSPAIGAGLANPYVPPSWVPTAILPDGGAVVGTTAVGGAADTGLLDLGYHYPATSSVGALTSASFTPASTTASAAGNVTVAFTTATTWPSTGKMVINMPTALSGGYTFNSGGTTTAGSLTGIDGSLAVSISGNIVTLTRSGGTNTSAGPVTFVLSHVQNPISEGSTGTYQFQTTNSGGTVLDQNLLVSATTITGTTYYVATTGNDSNPGSSGSPFLTLQKCSDTIAPHPGYTCIVKDGTYTAGFTTDAQLGTRSVMAGTALAPITIKAENRGGVTLDTSTTITGWSSLGGNKYISGVAGGTKTPVLWKVGSNVHMTSESSAGALFANNQYYYDSAADKFTIYSTTDPTASIFKEPGATPIKVQGSSYVVVDGFICQYALVGMRIGYSSGFPTPASQLTQSGTDHVTFQYCTTQYTVTWGVGVETASTNRTTNALLDHMTMMYNDLAVPPDANGHCVKCAANHNEDDGRYVTVSNSLLHDCAYHGIQMSNAWSHGYFHDNRIYNTSIRGSGQGADVRCGYSASSEPSDCNVYNNDLGGATATSGSSIGCGIYLQDTAVGARIYNNKIHDHNWHGIYIFYAGIGPTAPTGFLIYNNLIYNNGTAGIRSDSSHDGKIYNNVMYNNGEASIFGVGASLSLPTTASNGIRFFNNITYNTNAASINTSNVTYNMDGSNYNDLYRTAGFKVNWAGTTYTDLGSYSAASGNFLDTHSVDTDPTFVGPTHENFTIPIGASPAYQSATDISASFTFDFLNNTRMAPWDMGAINSVKLGDITSATIVPDNLNAAAAGNTTLTFTLPSTQILSTGKIVLTFPEGFILNNGGNTDVSSITGFDGTVTCSVSSRTLTITRNGDGMTADFGGTYVLVLNHTQNPFIPGPTGVYNLKIKDVQDNLLAVNSQISGNTIVGATVPVSSYAGLRLAGLTTH